MPVSVRRVWVALRALLAAFVVIGLVAFVSTPSFAASPAPTVSSVSPNAAGSAGGTVTINGTGFTGATAVSFGGTPGTGISVISPTELTVTVPAHAAGLVDVRVSAPLGTSAVSAGDHFTYEPAPSVVSVSPNLGTPAGGTTVTISGAGFIGVSSVVFGSTAATSFTTLSSSRITAVAPAGAAGTAANVVVTGAFGVSVTSTADQYTYEPAPSLTSFDSAYGVVAGGTVTLNGSNFVAITSVTFGGIAGTALAVSSPTKLTVKAPAHAAGPVPVVVTGTYGASSALTYNYAAVPIISTVSPPTGVLAGSGSNNVLISGSGFTGTSAVLFGTTPASIVGVSSDGTSIGVVAPAHAAGLVDVHVVLGDGTSAVTAGDKYTYVPSPTITAIAPNAGVLGGANTVTITGSNFAAGDTVDFGSSPGTSVAVASATKLTVVAPSGSAGQVNVTVTSPYGTSATVAADRYTYEAPPVITSVSPNIGVTAGGGTVTITGSGFASITKVTFGGVAGTSLTVVSPTQLTVKAPAVAATFLNTVDVQVVGTYGTSPAGSTLTPQSTIDYYKYAATPTVKQLSATTGPLAGGSTITITGTGFQPSFAASTSVLFGTTPATSFAIVDATTITAQVPAHAAGVTDVHVVLTDGTSAVAAGDKYTYEPVPAITKISPSAGPLAGGTTVTVTGSGFIGISTVSIDGASVAAHIVSTTSVTFVTPAESAGTSGVQFVGPYGTSALVAADVFTYEPLPVVSGVSANTGVLGGANVVTVTGSNLLGVSKVLFGTTASAKVVTVSATQLTVTVPAHVVGTVDVTVVGSYGTSVTVPADQYTYEPVPTITSVSPSAGALAGTNSVTINGTGFLGTGAKVEFATTLATNVVIVSGTRITAIAPSHLAGTVDVRVIGQYGTSPVVATDHYLYQSTASIAGIVTGGPPAAGQVGVLVTAYDGSGNYAGTATTSSTGAYTITGLGTGSYTLDFSPSDTSLAPQWFSGANTESTATSIALLAGQAVTGKNVVLAASGTIIAHVSGTAGSPPNLTDVNVLAYDAAGNFAGSASSSNAGTADIFGLAPGTYTLHFVPQSGTTDATTYQPTWLGNVATQSGSTTVTVTAGGTTTVPTTDLTAGGTITGAVTNLSNAAVNGVTVSAFDPSGNFVASTVTAGSGTYSLGGLPTGAYKLKFTPASTYAPQWYQGDATIESNGSTVAVIAGGSGGPVNIQLQPVASISGTVTGAGSAGVSGVEVIAYDADGNFASGTVTTGSGGYTLGGLARGAYTLDFIPGSNAYAQQWWSDEPSEATADVIQLTDGDVAAGDDVSLVPTGSISGNVFGQGASVVTLTNVSVEAFEAGNLVETATTDANGYYSLQGLGVGSYTLEFVPNSSPYGAEWWAGTTSEASATPISVAAGQSITGDSITLIGASISGAVTGTSGPLSGVRVYAVDAAGNGIGQTTTSSIGTYSISGIPPGSYTLEFVAPSGYTTQWFSGKPNESGATFITLTSGLAVTGKNVTLAPNTGSISGQITDFGDSSHSGIEDLTVDLYDAAGNFVAETLTGDSNGTLGQGDYYFGNLPAGSYTVFADGPSTRSPGFVSQWFSGKSTEATATLIPLATGQNVQNENLVLFENDSIQGTVTDAQGAVTDGHVTAFTSSGIFIGDAQTDPVSGAYQLTDLSAGTYYLQFTADGDATQWYADKTSLASATPIILTISPTTGGSVTGQKNVILSAGATITGTVSIPSPAMTDGIEVDGYDSSGTFIGSTDADSSGHYSFSGLAAGTYTLDFIPSLSEDTSWWYGQSAYGAQVFVTVSGSQQLTEPLVALAVTGVVSGEVEGPGGSNLPDIDVQLNDAASGATVQELTTDSAGTPDIGLFSFAGVPAGTYILSFSAEDGGYVAATSAPFAVTASGPGATVENEDVVLDAGASISGVVTPFEGAPDDYVSDLSVILSDSDGNEVAETSPDDGTDGGTNGSYSFSGLAAGSYTISFDPFSDSESAAPTPIHVTLTAGESSTDDNVTLLPATASISGAVSDSGSPDLPSADARVDLYDAAGTDLKETQADESGAYSFTNLAPGTYAIEFESADGLYQPAWWNGTLSESTATPITVAAGQSVTDIDAVLNLGASISGTVFTAGTPSGRDPFAEVVVYDAEGNEVGATQANSIGQYTVGGLAAGKYTVWFPQSDTGQPGSLASQWLGGSATEAGATLISLLEGQQDTGINVVLAKGASLSGTVVDPAGHRLDGIAVVVWQLEGGVYVQAGYGFTNGVGGYNIDELAAGSYKIGFVDNDDPEDGAPGAVFGDDYWNAAPTLASSTAITLTAGQALGGINATLTKISALANFATPPIPKVTGTAEVGFALTAASAAWAPATVVLTYQWERQNGSSTPVAISGATGTTYTPTALDVGDSIIVAVTGHKVGYSQDTTSSSVPTATVISNVSVG